MNKYIPSWVNKYVGMPWSEAGRDEANGLDCWGLVRAVLKNEAGIELPELGNVAYRDLSDKKHLAKVIEDYTSAVDGWAPQPFPEQIFDIIWLRNPYPIHFGVVVGGGCMIHIERDCQTIVEPFNTMRWNRRIQGLFRHESAL